MNIHTYLRIHEKRYILQTLKMCKWDIRRAAKVLGIGKSTLYQKMIDFGIGKGGK